ncbi:hypothetical protein EYF80_002521 [Liparis tanakae]|uniref:Uncharacterized protein n=1 Tax=Liparis tanakae TaxID=230148 RepID=A0A4Z2JAS8_9TELE|nr:hypothetical protein EYF80_002521 [Liparis tanakae]
MFMVNKHLSLWVHWTWLGLKVVLGPDSQPLAWTRPAGRNPGTTALDLIITKGSSSMGPAPPGGLEDNGERGEADLQCKRGETGGEGVQEDGS